jgi:hypothetical protein
MPYERCTVEGCTLTVPHIHATSQTFDVSQGYVVARQPEPTPGFTAQDWHRLEEQIRNGFTDAKD